MNIFYCILTALCFASWPILLKKTGSPSMEVSTIIVMIITVLPMVFQTLWKNNFSNLPFKFIGLAILVGLVNGVGMVFYAKLIDTPKPGLYVSIIAGLMPVFGLIMGYIIMGQPTIKFNHMIGMLAVCAGIWLLMK
ncbi:MAG: EamA family transporter [Candidatus Absconditicoccaceae bacterium]